MEYLINESTLTAIAETLRNKNGTTDYMTPEQMLIEIEKLRGDLDDCIMFAGDNGSDFDVMAINVEWDGTIEYSTDKSTWDVWDGSAISSSDGKLYMRGSGNTTFCTSEGMYLSISGTVGCYGNLNTLLEYSNPPYILTKAYCFKNMFYDCTSLTHAPELPATTLTTGCYFQMFCNCYSLNRAPKLPATTLAIGCYHQMFYNCTNLTRPPELPARELTMNCYYEMFYGCEIGLSDTQGDGYQTAYRIPTYGTGTTGMDSLTDMFGSTDGTFTGTPSINTTYYGAWGT